MKRTLLALVCASTVFAQDATEHLSRFAAGAGPMVEDGVFHLLDADRTPGQSNAIGFEGGPPGPSAAVTLTCGLRVLEGGDGGAFVFLNTAEYGARGAAPFVKSWVEPNLKRTFAVGIDVHNPKNEDMFGPWGNYRGMPEREVSLHWDGREIVKRLAPAEFRGDWVDCFIEVRHVIGGAEVTVKLGEGTVYDAYFIPGLLPYESRLAIGAGTRADATTRFDVKDVLMKHEKPASQRRAPARFRVFNHVLTNNKKTAYQAEVELPPLNWEFGRVILTLEIHDAGDDWDEWDRNGEISILTEDGKKLGIVPFITSYRTECHWAVDVTHFRPWLAGKTRFEIAAGTTFYKNRGYMMSVSLDFHHGRPDLEPYRIEPLWVGTARYKSADNHFKDFFTRREVALDGDCKAARIFTTTTGHSQVGEFTPSKRTIVVGDRRFANTLWKDDCYLNPNRPQFGTWKFSRAGWAPGDVVHPWWIDVPLAGETLALRYEPEPYAFPAGAKRPPDKEINKASHVVRSYLILYRDPAADMMPAPSLQVTNVAAKSNAAKAGLKRGDYFASYDGKPVRNLADLRTALQAAAASGRETIPVVVYRGAQRIEYELAPGRMGVNLQAR